MTPGRYLRLRRQAAGLALDAVPIDGMAMLAIERDARAPTDIELWALSLAFDFDVPVLVSVARGVIPDICRDCGCSQWDPCLYALDGAGSCHWVESDLCSACADRARPLPEGLAA